MKLNEIRDNPGARKKSVRVGRGEGSGIGKTCGRGTKGQGSRTGVSLNGFEGGQTALYRRLPKRGFSNVMFATPIESVTLKQIQSAMARKIIDVTQPLNFDVFKQLGFVSNNAKMVKLIGSDVLTQSLKIEVHRASAGALKSVENAKGSLTITAA
jgi:large subunit ribosomal protein L15